MRLAQLSTRTPQVKNDLNGPLPGSPEKVTTRGCPAEDARAQIILPREYGSGDDAASAAVVAPSDVAAEEVAMPGDVAAEEVAMPEDVAAEEVAMPEDVVAEAVAMPGDVAAEAVAMPGDVAAEAEEAKMPRAAEAVAEAGMPGVAEAKAMRPRSWRRHRCSRGRGCCRCSRCRPHRLDWTSCPGPSTECRC